MDVETPGILDLRGVVILMLSAVWGVILLQCYQVAEIMHLLFGGSSLCLGEYEVAAMKRSALIAVLETDAFCSGWAPTKETYIAQFLTK